jgi:hypothetical protein
MQVERAESVEPLGQDLAGESDKFPLKSNFGVLLGQIAR